MSRQWHAVMTAAAILAAIVFVWLLVVVRIWPLTVVGGAVVWGLSWPWGDEGDTPAD